MTRAASIVERNARVYRQTWRGSLFTSFLTPTLFMLSIGVGVGTLVDSGSAALPGGVGFLAFFAPGLLAATCMQTASFESSWPIQAKMTWQRNYEAISATPIRAVDIVAGELTWIAARLTMGATVFVVVMRAFGVPHSPVALFAIPAAVLTGLAFSSAIIAYAATLKTSGNNFNAMFRFIITPLYLFSGVFFPVSRLPVPLQKLATLTPLFHGVALTRGLTLGTLQSSEWMMHAGYLATMLVIGAVAATWTFDRRLRV